MKGRNCLVALGLFIALPSGGDRRRALAAPVAMECAFAVVERSGIRDIHESPFNGPEGYAFITEHGSEKTGDVPVKIGHDPVRSFDRDVYASNFQGPILIRRPNLRPQWEWTASGEPQSSDRSYPLLAARACAASAVSLPTITLHVAEHDEWPWANDAIGAFSVDLSACQDVLTPQRSSGWTERRHSSGLPMTKDGEDADDLTFVEYVLWCYRCTGDHDCEEGIVWQEPTPPR